MERTSRRFKSSANKDRHLGGRQQGEEKDEKRRGKNHRPLICETGGPVERRRVFQTDANKSLVPVFEMSRAITITYDLKPPADTPQSKLAPSKTQTFAVKDGESYYAGLRAAISTAKDTVGKELTEWRDQVGGLEKGKDAKPPKTQADADEDEDEEEEGKRCIKIRM